MTTPFTPDGFSLTPGFSPVLKAAGKAAVSTASRAAGKTVETVLASALSSNTGLKPGANENCFALRICR
jgi:hypothetical protein